MTEKQELYFDGELVGYFTQLGAEMNRVYGEFQSNDATKAYDFVQRACVNDLEVSLKSTWGEKTFIATMTTDEPNWIELRLV